MSLGHEHRPGGRSWKARRVLEALYAIVREDPAVQDERAAWSELVLLVLVKLVSDRDRERAALDALARRPHEPYVRAPYRYEDWTADAFPAEARLAFLTTGRAARPDGARGLGLYAGLAEGLARAPEGDVLEVVSHALGEARTRLTRADVLQRALRELGRLAFDDAADIDETLAWLDERLADGPFGTLHPTLVEALVRGVAPRPGERVLDPRAGDGRFLACAHAVVLEARDAPAPRLSADEPGREAFLVLALRLLLCDARIGRVERIDGRDRPPFALGAADRAELVLGAVDAGARGDAATDPALADTDRALRRVAPGGRAVLVVPERLLSLPEAEDLRRRMVETMRLRAIVHLPPGAGTAAASASSAGPAAVLVLSASGRTDAVDVLVLPRGVPGREREQAEAVLAFLERNAAGLAPAAGAGAFRVPVDEVLRFDERGAFVACDLDLRRAGDVEPEPGSTGRARALPVPRTRSELEPPLVVRPELVGRKRGAALALVGLAAWLLWAWLWLPLVTFAAWVAGFELFGEQNALDPTPYVVFLVGWLALMGLVSLALCTWSAYNRLAFGGENDRRRTPPPLAAERQAERAGVPRDTLASARRAKRARFAFGADGAIAAVEPLG